MNAESKNNPLLALNLELKKSLTEMQNKLNETKQEKEVFMQMNKEISKNKMDIPTINKKNHRGYLDETHQKILDIYLERDKLTALTNMQENEIASLKLQLSAAHLSHQEVEISWNQLKKENQILQDVLSKNESMFNTHRSEIDELNNIKSSSYVLIRKLINIMNVYEHKIHVLYTENKSLIESERHKNVLVPIFNDTDLTGILFNFGNHVLNKKCSRIIQQTHIPLKQKVQAIVNELGMEYEKIAEDMKRIEKEKAELEESVNKLKDMNELYRGSLSALSKDWEMLESNERMIKQSAFGKADQQFINFLAANSGFRDNFDMNLADIISKTEFSDIFRNLWLANERLKKQILALQLDISNQEEIRRLAEGLGIDSNENMTSIFKYLITKQVRLKSDRRDLAVALRDETISHKESKEKLSNLELENSMLHKKVEKLESERQILKQRNIELASSLSELQIGFDAKFVEFQRNKNKELKETLNVHELEMEKLRSRLAKVEEEKERNIEQMKYDLSAQKESYHKECQLIKESYKMLSMQYLEAEKTSKQTIKNLKKQHKQEINMLQKVNEEQRRIFEDAAAQMKLKTEEDTNLTTKLTQALEQSERKNRILTSKIASLESRIASRPSGII